MGRGARKMKGIRGLHRSPHKSMGMARSQNAGRRKNRKEWQWGRGALYRVVIRFNRLPWWLRG